MMRVNKPTWPKHLESGSHIKAIDECLRLRKALEYYAEKDNWMKTKVTVKAIKSGWTTLEDIENFQAGLIDQPYPSCLEDKGKLARKALGWTD